MTYHEQPFQRRVRRLLSGVGCTRMASPETTVSGVATGCGLLVQLLFSLSFLAFGLLFLGITLNIPGQLP